MSPKEDIIHDLINKGHTKAGGIYVRVEMLLKDIRDRKNISLRELERMTGISKTHLNAIELNEKEPSISILVRIAKALNVEIKELYEVKW